MSSLQEFETALKEVVDAKRLSASKVTSLSDMAMKNMEHDTQLVSILYRTHKSLSSASKVNSLYVLDAIARAARSRANKHHLSSKSSTGNAATFLLKLESFLDGLVEDMATMSSLSAKEKTQKILDIWAKGHTFSEPVIVRLRAITQQNSTNLKQKTNGKEPDRGHVSSSRSTTPPGPPPAVPFSLASLASSTSTPSNTTPPVPPLPDAQSALIALLTQAAQASASAVPGSSTSIPNALSHSTPQPGAGAAFSALNILQQLTETAKLHSGSGAQTPGTSLPGSVPLPPSQAQAEQSGSGRDPRLNGSSGAGFGSYSQQDEPKTNGFHGKPDFNGGMPPQRGGRFGARGRGRGGGFHHGNNHQNHNQSWEDRQDRFPRHGRQSNRSRSRSPPPPRSSSAAAGGAGAAPRDPRLRSPNRYTNRPGFQENSSGSAGASVSRPEVDEFGREIRPESPDTSSASTATPPPQQKQAETVIATRDPRAQSSVAASAANAAPSTSFNPSSTSSHSQAEASAQIPSSAQSTHPTESTSTPPTSQLGLDSFNIATFNFMDPTAWSQLGEMWQVTNGTMPSQEELMQFVMMGGMGAATQMGGMGGIGGMSGMNGMGVGMGGQVDPMQQQQQWMGMGMGMGMGSNDWGYSNANGGVKGSEAGMLAGADGNSTGASAATSAGSTFGTPSATPSGGRMQKVGDKWMFVQGTAVAGS